MTTPSGRFPLAGLRVIDFSWVLAGPMTTKMLALMGAEIVKVESSVRPEYARRDGHFRLVNNNKKSCTVDFTKPEGQELVRRLVSTGNILVENFSAGVLAKYGLDYASMRAVKPDLIYVSGSGLGRTGPQRDALAYGTLLQAYSGRAKLIGDFNPQLEGMGIMGWTDPASATWEIVAVLAAVINWRRTGSGAFIDLSMLESTVALLPETLLRDALGATPYPGRGNIDPGAAPSGCFLCADDDAWLAVSVTNERQWQGLCRAMERPELAVDPRFADAVLRLANKRELDEAVAAWTANQNADEAERTLMRNGVPAGRSRTIAQVIDDPESARRELFPQLADGSRTTSLPWRCVDEEQPQVNAAPKLGADNDYVFGTLLGLPPGEVEHLKRAEVIR